jgi:hypothetical protein
MAAAGAMNEMPARHHFVLHQGDASRGTAKGCEAQAQK